MLPYTDYLFIPDAPRLYLNREFNNDRNGLNSDVEIRRFLQQHKIDYRNHNFNVDVLRNSLLKDFDLKGKI